MYTQFFQLKQSPFSIAPDPRYLFMSERHREALAHLLYGVGSGGGFVLLTGEIGAGKTTVCRCFMEQIPLDCKLAYIFNPKLSVEELLRSICDEFAIAAAPAPAALVSVKDYVDAINAYLLASHAQGRNNVLIIDEAQNLSAEVLEQLRLLTNLETSERKLLQIILIGQPELRAMVARPELEQLAQRVIARYHLGSLTEVETGAYIAHRLAVAGATAIAPFPQRLVGLIHRLSKGVPRRINLLCDRALLGAYVENQPQVTPAIVRRAAAEVFAGADTTVANRARWPLVAAGVLGGVMLSAAVWQLVGPAQRGTAVVAMVASKPVRVAAVPAAARDTTKLSANDGAATDGTANEGATEVATPVALPITDADTAGLRQLAALWGLALPDGEPCPTAARLNLRCLQGRGGLAELRQLDRPALLALRESSAQLTQPKSQPKYVLLTALDQHSATIVDAAGKPQRFAIEALTPRLDGEFITFWRAPRSWRDQVGAGDRGPEVDWLTRRLAQMVGLKKPQEEQVLNARWLARLTDFQLGQQLKADGVAGPKTFIRLYQLAGVQEPRLLTAVVAGGGK